MERGETGDVLHLFIIMQLDCIWIEEESVICPSIRRK